MFPPTCRRWKSSKLGPCPKPPGSAWKLWLCLGPSIFRIFSNGFERGCLKTKRRALLGCVWSRPVAGLVLSQSQPAPINQTFCQAGRAAGGPAGRSGNFGPVQSGLPNHLGSIFFTFLFKVDILRKYSGCAELFHLRVAFSFASNLHLCPKVWNLIDLDDI